jgi:hypothetical protein
MAGHVRAGCMYASSSHVVQSDTSIRNRIRLGIGHLSRNLNCFSLRTEHRRSRHAEHENQQKASAKVIHTLYSFVLPPGTFIEVGCNSLIF